LRFTGPDAHSFLQGQVSNDTRRLAEGRGLLAAYSSPQGRVLAIMHLLPHSSGIAAVLPRDLISPTVEALRRFVLRAKVTIEDGGEALSVAGHYGEGLHGAEGQHVARGLQSAGIAVPPPNVGYTETDGIGVAAVSGDPSRYWVIGAAETLAERGLAGDADHAGHDATQAADIEHGWRLADVRAGLPQIYLSTREAFVAQMLNLDLLEAISFSKGCYTGQEIIARTQHLGRIKRRLYRLQLSIGDWRIGQPLHLNDGRAGRLIEVVRSGDGFEALAVLNVQPNVGADGGSISVTESGDGEAGGATVAASSLPLPYKI
jgi:hypothetical protein